MTVEVKDGNLVISIPLSPARPSASGKTLVVATTGGFTTTTALVDNKPIKVNVTATIAK
jgi:hypothetical protein